MTAGSERPSDSEAWLDKLRGQPHHVGVTSKQYAWQLAQIAKGHCRTCGKKAKQGTRCERHRKAHAIYEKARRAAKRALRVSG